VRVVVSNSLSESTWMAESGTSFKNKKKYFLMCSDGFGDSLEFIIFGIPLGFYISIYIYMNVVSVT